MKFDKIVIEGPNNVGKSTLISGLMLHLGRFGWQVEHTSQLCPNDFEFYDDLLSNEQPMIFDRLHIGEMVYPEMYDRSANISQNEFEELLEKHEQHTLIVFVDADYEFIICANSNKNEKFNYREVRREKGYFYENYKFIKCNYANCIYLKNHLGDDKLKYVKQILEVIGYDQIQ